MLDIPADAAWVWLGLLVGSAAMFGAIADLSAAPPNAERVAETVDEVRAVEYTAEATVPIEASAAKIGQSSLALRGPGGTAHATFEQGTVTPVRPGTNLSDVLHGEPPGAAFPKPGTLRQAVVAARSRPPEWHETGDAIRIRRIRYGEVDCVLVGP